jgi:hypothetical protein
MKKGRKSVETTRDLETGSRKAAPTTTKMACVKGTVILSVKQPAACNQGLMESPVELPCRKSQEGSLVSTSSMSKNTREVRDRCPVTGKKIPSIEEIAKSLKQGLLLTENWPESPQAVALRIAKNLHHWAKKYGLAEAAKRGNIIFEQGLIFNLHFLEEDGENVDGRSKYSRGSDNSISNDDQRLLPDNGDVLEGDSGRSSSGIGHESDEGGDGRIVERGKILALPARECDQPPTGVSLTLLLDEMSEAEKDIQAFKAAHEIIHARIQEVRDESRFLKLVEWSGTSAVMGSLDLAIHALERTYNEMENILYKIHEGEINNLDEE